MHAPRTQQPADGKSANEAHDTLLFLGKLSAAFARVKRIPRYPDGARESDVEHSFHLSISATELAALYFPGLDAGLIAQFSNVHDLPELYAGDTPTFNISDEDRAKKEQAEKAALDRLLSELPPHTAQLLERYERQEEPEARFVRLVDKLLPVIMMIVAGSANTFKEDYGVASLAALEKIREKEVARLQAQFPEFPFVLTVRKLMAETANKSVFPHED